MKDLILIGGGGHCKSCIDVIEAGHTFKIKGILDKVENIGESVSGYPVIGTDNDIPELSKKSISFFITVGQIKTPDIRIKIFNQLKSLGIILPVIVSPFSYVARDVVIGEGTIIMHHALLNSGCRIGNNCIINSKSLIEHDCLVGDNTHISTGAILNGSVEIGNNCFVGSGSTINNNISVVDSVVIPSGSLISKNVKEPGVFKSSRVMRGRNL